MEASHDRPSIERAEELVGSVLDDGFELDGIVSQGDRPALGALRALRKRGLLPGRDVRVIGMDNTFVSEISHLSSIERNATELAREGAHALLTQLNGHKAHDVIVPHSIVRRGTTLVRDLDAAYWAGVDRVLRSDSQEGDQS